VAVQLSSDDRVGLTLARELTGEVVAKLSSG
jgi:hypothetical protein